MSAPVCPPCIDEQHPACPGGVQLDDGSWVLCGCDDCLPPVLARTVRRRFARERGTQTQIDPTRPTSDDED